MSTRIKVLIAIILAVSVSLAGAFLEKKGYLFQGKISPTPIFKSISSNGYVLKYREVKGAALDSKAMAVLVVDSDKDGLTDAREDELGTDKYRSDTDGDGLSDALETRVGTSPIEEDSDEDGSNDAYEFKFGTDPLNSKDYWDPEEKRTYVDSDGDGMSDYFEYEIGTDPNKADSDRDGLPDAMEYKYFNGITLDPTVKAQLVLNKGQDGKVVNEVDLGGGNKKTYNILVKNCDDVLMVYGWQKLSNVFYKSVCTNTGAKAPLNWVCSDLTGQNFYSGSTGEGGSGLVLELLSSIPISCGETNDADLLLEL